MDMKMREKYMFPICLFQSASQFFLSQAPTDADKGLCFDAFRTAGVKYKEQQNCAKSLGIVLRDFT